jgi:hypothetical protein
LTLREKKRIAKAHKISLGYWFVYKTATDHIIYKHKTKGTELKRYFGGEAR